MIRRHRICPSVRSAFFFTVGLCLAARLLSGCIRNAPENTAPEKPESLSHTTCDTEAPAQNIRSSYDPFWNEIPLDCQTLELSEIAWENSDELDWRLRSLGALETVQIADGLLDLPAQKRLLETFPQIRFLWNVSLGSQISLSSSQTEADISNQPITDFTQFCEALAALPSLKQLCMCDCGLSNLQMEELCKSYPEIKFIWKIYMKHWSLRTDAVAFSTMVGFHETEKLTSEDIEVLKYCTDLVALDLGHHAFTDISVIGQLTDLKILILADNSARFDPSPLQNLTNLVYLELFCNYESLNDVSALEPMKKLVDLNLCFDYILDVRPLLHFPQLQRLWISDTYKLTPYQKQQLRDAYPDTEICFDCDRGSTGSGWRTHPRYFAMLTMFRQNIIVESFFDGIEGIDS